MDNFSKRSRRAIILFTLCFLVIVLIPRIYYYFKSPGSFSLSQRIKELPEEEQKEIKRRISYYHNQSKKQKNKHKFSPPASKFNPNEYLREDWMALGLSEKQAQTIINFNRFGFYSVEDMQKCFIFQNEDFFDLIADSLVFPSKSKRSSDKSFGSGLAVDLNRASKEELKQLKGIGDYFADKIISYRERLGGFIDVNQLLEISKFDAEKLKLIKPYLLINKNDINKIDLNAVDVKTLKSHPYVNDWNLANSIVKMRRQKERYTSVEEIKESVLMTDSVYKKLEPYLITK